MASIFNRCKHMSSSSGAQKQSSWLVAKGSAPVGLVRHHDTYAANFSSQSRQPSHPRAHFGPRPVSNPHTAPRPISPAAILRTVSARRTVAAAATAPHFIEAQLQHISPLQKIIDLRPVDDVAAKDDIDVDQWAKFG